MSWQESYDNSGLIVGRPETEVESGLLCVDITEEVLNEAIDRGCGIVISHHPIVFKSLRKITGEGYVERVVERAIQSGVALYASHTNLDSARGGMSWKLAEQLGVSNCRMLFATQSPEVGFGVVGELSGERDALEFLREVKERLNIGAIRYSDVCFDKISKVAICTGAGGSQIEDAVRAGAELYLSADFRYNNFMDADSRIIIADIGHFESEYCAIDLLYDIITKKISTFALCKSETSRNPINYLV